MTLKLDSTVSLSTGYTLPLLGLGVYQNDDCVPACSAALKAGYRHIDSARAYYNEAEVGRAVRASGLAREEVFVTTKVVSPEHGYDSTLEAVRSSLANLNFDYIDLYLIHDPLSGSAKRLEAYKALVEMKKQGKIRTIGVSNYGPRHLDEIKEAGLELPSVNQIELHPFCQQKPIVDYCFQQSPPIVIQAYTPLVRAKKNDDPTLVKISQKHHKELAQVLIRWSLQRGFVVLPKSSQPTRVATNADVYDFELDADDMAALDALDRGKDGAVTWNPVEAP